MKRPVIATLLLSAALFVPGCPIYDDEGCQTDSQCAPGYVCQLTTGECVTPYDPTPECDEPSDCRSGQTCDRYGECRSAEAERRASAVAADDQRCDRGNERQQR